ncbi:MAG: hypothetical protein LBP54_03290, partial [Campylobacteraceae bacterium]|nr:hypothetical protein [Campylobacteraceae bacterium]
MDKSHIFHKKQLMAADSQTKNDIRTLYKADAYAHKDFPSYAKKRICMLHGKASFPCPFSHCAGCLSIIANRLRFHS